MKIFTKRLLLRPYAEEDFDALREIDSDPEVTRYRSRQFISEEMTCDFIQHYRELAQAEQPTGYGFVLVLRESDQVIGQCGITREGEQRAFIWYSLNRRYWNQGYMSEAARALIDFGFDQLKLERIMASCHPANIASMRVMEKIGMSRYLPNFAEGDMEALLMRVNYSIHKDEWTP